MSIFRRFSENENWFKTSWRCKTQTKVVVLSRVGSRNQDFTLNPVDVIPDREMFITVSMSVLRYVAWLSLCVTWCDNSDCLFKCIYHPFKLLIFYDSIFFYRQTSPCYRTKGLFTNNCGRIRAQRNGNDSRHLGFFLFICICFSLILSVCENIRSFAYKLPYSRICFFSDICLC